MYRARKRRRNPVSADTATAQPSDIFVHDASTCRCPLHSISTRRYDTRGPRAHYNTGFVPTISLTVAPLASPGVENHGTVSSDTLDFWEPVVLHADFWDPVIPV
ncbi:hypothetical protein RvY_12089 [Ramazzottius varieornatus]|uniref:Uncharacterized protein n=1 Tax=Ramazzottius varieornatus TaxID=947166 RepID=A0A1D1VIA2_RAMVA|nr:hypothetical protein RvY_12089 [Ramazzottius varieornatus]